MVLLCIVTELQTAADLRSNSILTVLLGDVMFVVVIPIHKPLHSSFVGAFNGVPGEQAENDSAIRKPHNIVIWLKANTIICVQAKQK